MTKQRLSMKLLWKMVPEFKDDFFDTDDGDDVEKFLEFVEQRMKHASQPKVIKHGTIRATRPLK